MSDELEKEVTRLWHRLEVAEERLDELEEANHDLRQTVDALTRRDPGGGPAGTRRESDTVTRGPAATGWVDANGDHRDEDAIQWLESYLAPGDIVTAKQLRDAYKNATAISKKATLRDRAEKLAKSPLFESTGYGKWRFVGRQ